MYTVHQLLLCNTDSELWLSQAAPWKTSYSWKCQGNIPFFPIELYKREQYYISYANKERKLLADYGSQEVNKAHAGAPVVVRHQIKRTVRRDGRRWRWRTAENRPRVRTGCPGCGSLSWTTCVFGVCTPWDPWAWFTSSDYTYCFLTIITIICQRSSQWQYVHFHNGLSLFCPSD